MAVFNRTARDAMSMPNNSVYAASKAALRSMGRTFAGAALFLASAESAYVTGVDLPVDGGVIVATQVNEKFGTLRFYVDGGDEEVFRLIDAAEQESATVCELCGVPGMLVMKEWCSTRCSSCRQKC